MVGLSDSTWMEEVRSVYVEDKIINFDLLCDKCYAMIKEDEDMYGFTLIDSFGRTKDFRGHKECVDEIYELIRGKHSDIDNANDLDGVDLDS